MFSVKGLFKNMFGCNSGKFKENGEFDHVVEEVGTIGEEVNPVKRVLVIKRKYYEKGTHGLGIFPSGETMDMLERPWADNTPHISCVPEGEYAVTYEESPLVFRLTKEKYTHAYTVSGVPYRTLIRFHQANYPNDLEGCISMGSAAFNHKTPVVWKSGPEFERFMRIMGEECITHVRFEEESGNPYNVRAV